MSWLSGSIIFRPKRKKEKKINTINPPQQEKPDFLYKKNKNKGGIIIGNIIIYIIVFLWIRKRKLSLPFSASLRIWSLSLSALLNEQNTKSEKRASSKLLSFSFVIVSLLFFLSFFQTCTLNSETYIYFFTGSVCLSLCNAYTYMCVSPVSLVYIKFEVLKNILQSWF